MSEALDYEWKRGRALTSPKLRNWRTLDAFKANVNKVRRRGRFSLRKWHGRPGREYHAQDARATSKKLLIHAHQSLSVRRPTELTCLRDACSTSLAQTERLSSSF